MHKDCNSVSRQVQIGLHRGHTDIEVVPEGGQGITRLESGPSAVALKIERRPHGDSSVGQTALPVGGLSGTIRDRQGCLSYEHLIPVDSYPLMLYPPATNQR